MTESPHLWEIKHAYYCSEDNYFSNECHSTYSSWISFMKEFGDADLDYNLLFRWDWKDADDPDNELNQDELRLFFMGQRKGKYFSSTIRLFKDDEPDVRKFLKSRMMHLWSLWEPLSKHSTPSGKPEESEEPEPIIEPDKDIRTGMCECCNFQPIYVKSYEPYGKPASWLCDMCCSTLASNAHHYPDQYPDGRLLKTIIYAANSAIYASQQDSDNEATKTVLQMFEVIKNMITVLSITES